MNKKIILGQIGEELACEYLKQKKYKILERNYRQPWGELDIIAATPEKILAFIEVKTLRKDQNSKTGEGLIPEDNLTAAKLKKLKRTAALYAGNHPELINDKKGWGIDLIAITIPDNALLNDSLLLTKILKNCDIKYYENI